MFKDIQTALTGLLLKICTSEEVYLSVRFDTPSREWIATLTSPVISFYLFDIEENYDKRKADCFIKPGSCKAEKMLPPRYIDLSYLVSVFTSDTNDEHNLLWQVTASLIKHYEYLQEELKDSLKVSPYRITAKLADKESKANLLELWNVLDVPPRPALHYIITVPMDLDVVIESPLVLTRQMKFRSTTTAENLRVNQQMIEPNGRVRDYVLPGTREPRDFAREQAGQGMLFDTTPMERPWAIELNRRNTKVYRTSYHIGGVVRDAQGVPVKAREDTDKLPLEEWIVRAAHSAMASCRVDALGRFVLGHLPEGETTLQVLHWDRVSGQEQLLKQVTIRVPADSYDIVLE